MWTDNAVEEMLCQRKYTTKNNFTCSFLFLFMWLLENLKLHMWLTFVACIVFLLDSTGLGHFLQVLELHVLYLVIICSFPHIQVFDLNMLPTFLSSTTPTRKLESALFYLLALHFWDDNEFCFWFNFSPFGVVMGGVVFLFLSFSKQDGRQG